MEAIDYIVKTLDHGVVPDYISIGKHRIKLLGVAELIRQKEVQQRPQLVQVVLEWRASDEETRLCLQEPNLLGKLKR